MNNPIITVFGGHNPRPGSLEYKEAEKLGELLANHGFTAATGGYGGTMEAVLKGAGGGIGFTVSIFSASPNKYVTKDIPTPDLFSRITTILETSAGFICLKGGTGTLLELAAAWEQVNKKMIARKPIVCLGKFWKPVVDTLSAEPSIENLKSLRNVSHSAASYIDFANTPEEAVGLIEHAVSAGG